MQLKNDIEGLNTLDDVIHEFYEFYGRRQIRVFMRSKHEDWDWHYVHFILNHKHIIKCGIGQDRNMWLGGLELAIGPHYFGPADFWDYENSQRFSLEATTEAVFKNLRLLDEFLGYKDSEVLSKWPSK